MSGYSDDIVCPRCGGILHISGDWKPIDTQCGFCLDCGMQFWTQFNIMDDEDLQEAREEYAADMGAPMNDTDRSKLDKEKLKAFDSWAGL